MQKLLVGVNLTPLWLNTHPVDEVEAEDAGAAWEDEVAEDELGVEVGVVPVANVEDDDTALALPSTATEPDGSRPTGAAAGSTRTGGDEVDCNVLEPEGVVVDES